MPLRTGNFYINGTAQTDYFIGANSVYNQTWNGGAGNDFIIGNYGFLHTDSSHQGNYSFATAANIDDAALWYTDDAPFIATSGIPFTTIHLTGADEAEYFEVTIGAGETITIDADWATFNTVLQLLDSTGAEVAFNDDDFSGDDDANLNTESSLTYTATVAGTYVIRVGQSFGANNSEDNSANVTSGDIAAGGETLINVSVTGHSATGTSRIFDRGTRNEIDAGAGDDYVYGGRAVDRFVASDNDGNDYYNGGAGVDIADFEFVTSDVTVDLRITGAQDTNGAGTDTFVSIETLAGSNTGNDTLTLGDAAGSLYGRGGNDVLTGGLGGDWINGGDGNDLMYGGGGDDRLQGSYGQDSLYGGAGDDILTGGLDQDSLYGGAGDDVLDGGLGQDSIYSGAGDDWVVFDGNTLESGETYDGGTGIDRLSLFAPGNDTLYDFRNNVTLQNFEAISFLSHARAITVQMTASQFNFDNAFSSISARYGGGELSVQIYTDTAASDIDVSNISIDLSNISIRDVGFTLTGDGEENVLTGSDARDTLYGLAGDDVLDGGLENDLLYGGAGDDALDGGLGKNELYGGAGDDMLSGGGGPQDILDGGSGVDTAIYDFATNGIQISLLADTASGAQASNDTLISIENLIGSSFADNLRGDNGRNALEGGDGNDVLIGYNGVDSLFGGQGRDTLNGGSGADVIDGGDGVDQVRYNGSQVGVDINLLDGTASGGHAEGDTLIGIENLFGSSHNDSLYGDASNNKIFGHTGDDALAGNGGINRLYGGDGADSFVLSDGFAYVMDFVDDVDRLDVSGYGFNSLAEALSNIDQVGDHARFSFEGDVLLILNTFVEDLSNDVLF